MSINFPTSLDSFTNPTATSKRNNPSLAGEISDKNDAIVALETKVGIDSSAVTSSLDYKLKSTSSVSPGHKHTSSDITDPTSILPTGSIIPYAGSSAPSSSWLLCDGSAKSRTTYAALYTVTSITYGSGDGVTTFNLPDLRSRIPLGVGTGTKVATFASRSTDTITVTGLTNAANNEFQTGQAVVYHTTSSVITGLSNDTTYYVIYVSNTSFKLASTLANAQNGTQISLSGNGSGTQTFTQTLTARTLGDTGGEENHAMSSTELLSHTHTAPMENLNAADGGSNIQGRATNRATWTSAATGGNAAMNNIQPFLALNYLIRT